MKPLFQLFPRTAAGLLALAAVSSPSLSAAAGEDAPLSPAARQEVVDSLGRLLEETYVIPETASRLRELTRSRLESGAYDGLDADAFAAGLTADLQGLSGDRHLRVMFGEQLTPITRDGGPGAPEGGPRRVVVRQPGPGSGSGPGPGSDPGQGSDGGIFEGRQGIQGAEILPGNIGLVRIDLFMPLDRERDAAARAMETVAGADALIFDLRFCAGGTPEMVHFLTSYLFPPEPKHLLTYFHAREAPDSAFTVDVPGPRRPDVPVFILTSPFTASGGEEFTYGLKHHGRATVVGETTAGGGHGGGVLPVAAGFHAFIPNFRPVHPATGGGWEGVGVLPDRECPAHLALLTAQREAVHAIAGRAGDGKLEALRTELDAEYARATAPLDTAAHAAYGGRYGIRTIFVEEDGLYLQRTGGPKLLLVAGDTPDDFSLAVLPAAKVRFVRGADGAIEELHVFNMRGEWEITRRDGAESAAD